VHPIEHLRYVARSAGDPSELAEEAADALQGLSGDPRALLMACQRLLGAHPACGPLWWLAARVMCSLDPVAAAQDAQELLAGDLTAEELAGALPAGATVVTAPTRRALGGLCLRPDCTAHVVGSPASLRRALRVLAGDVAAAVGYLPAEAAEALRAATVLLVEPAAASTAGMLAPLGSGALVRLAAEAGVAAWLVTAEGCALPEELFEAAAARAALSRPVAGLGLHGGGPHGGRGGRVGPHGPLEPGSGDEPVERLAVDGFSLAVTTRGPEAVLAALAAPGCPVPGELTRS
jgi:hypothetical protein